MAADTMSRDPRSDPRPGDVLILPRFLGSIEIIERGRRRVRMGYSASRAEDVSLARFRMLAEEAVVIRTAPEAESDA
jgi:hypothetical protein